MTTIVCDIRHEVDGQDALSSGVLEWTPTARRGYDGALVLPEPFSVTLDGETAPSVSVRHTPVDASWAWAVVERQMRGTSGKRRLYTVPDSETPVQFVDLVEVDPSTLEPIADYPTVAESIAAEAVARADADADLEAATATAQMTADGAVTAYESIPADITNPATEIGGALSATFVTGGEASAGDRRGSLAGTPESPLVTSALYLESPYSHDSQFVHPDIVDAGAGKWSGYRYWMVATPYTFTTISEENPTLFASDDGLNWIPAPGAPAPLATPGGAGIYSDPDMVLVAGTMHLFWREYGTGYEKIWRSTSTNGATWSTPSTVIDFPASATGTLIISPAVIHDGSQFAMFSSKDFAALEKRTSADGTTWSAPVSVTLTGAPTQFAHLDVINAGAGKLFFLVQEYGTTGTSEAPAAGTLRLARSTDGGSNCAFVTAPILDARSVATRNIYRTTGLWEERNGEDYFRLWFSGIDMDDQGREVWRIGHAEGYAPDAARPATGLVVPGNLESKGDISAVQAGFRRLTSRLGMFTRLITSRLWANEARIGFAILDQKRLAKNNPSWLFGKSPAPLVIASNPGFTTAQGSSPTIRLINRATDVSNITAADHFDIRVSSAGAFQIVYYKDSTGATSIPISAALSGDVSVLRDLLATRGVKGSTWMASPKGDFGPSADGQQPTDNPLRIFGDNLRIVTKRTPTSTADTSLYPGCVTWDDNYLYVKTSAGWKRTALSTW